MPTQYKRFKNKICANKLCEFIKNVKVDIIDETSDKCINLAKSSEGTVLAFVISNNNSWHFLETYFLTKLITAFSLEEINFFQRILIKSLKI